MSVFPLRGGGESGEGCGAERNDERVRSKEKVTRSKNVPILKKGGVRLGKGCSKGSCTADEIKDTGERSWAPRVCKNLRVHRRP